MTNNKLKRVNFILGKAEGVSQKEYDELSKEVVAVWEETINLTAKNFNLKSERKLLVNQIDRLENRIVFLQK